MPLEQQIDVEILPKPTSLLQLRIRQMATSARKRVASGINHLIPAEKTYQIIEGHDLSDESFQCLKEAHYGSIIFALEARLLKKKYDLNALTRQIDRKEIDENHPDPDVRDYIQFHKKIDKINTIDIESAKTA